MNECPDQEDPAKHVHDEASSYETKPFVADLASKPVAMPSAMPGGNNASKTKQHENRIFGDYELLEEIARGGMGVVYRARQMSLRRIVALKMILTGEFATDQEVTRFYSEAEAAASLDHLGIVPVYEVGQHEGKHFFSMAFVEGQSLAEKLRNGPLSPDVAARYLHKIAAAIDHAHRHGVIHRDLKPANVLVDANDEPKVTDFGLAKQLERDAGLTATGQVFGTPSYMPPEQASGATNTISAAADIYSLGAILYALLTGKPPFQSARAMDTILQVIEQEPVAPRRLNSKIPMDLESVCLKCLQKDPATRYASAQELADDLHRFLNGEPVKAQATSTFQRAWTSMLRETRHVEVMANWGRVWLWHGALIFILCLATNGLIWADTKAVWLYLFLWGIGFAALLLPIWFYRFRGGVALTPIERQLGQVWGMFTAAVLMTGIINHLMGFEPLMLLPLAVVECGMAFGCMAAILGGSFYPMALICFAFAVITALAPNTGPLVFGTAFAVGLLIPGWRFSSKKLPAA